MQKEAASFLEDKKVLITGSSGYIASNFIQRISKRSCQVVPISRSIAGAAALQDSAFWAKALAGVDFIFHFSAQTSVSVAETDPLSDFRANVLPVIAMLEACREKKFSPVVILAGTATTVGVPDVTQVDESMTDKPVTMYDLHKLMAEQYLKYYAARKTIRGAILRLFNVYGPGPSSSTASRGILNQMIRKALRGEELTLFGQGDPVRDYIYVEDVVSAFLSAAERIDAINGGHFFLGTGRRVTLAQAFDMVAKQCAQLTGREVSVRSVQPVSPLSPIESRRYVADWRRFGQATGWKPTVTLENGIDRTLEYFKSA
jgi:UDP-glucose 4-epimerase